MLTWWVYATGYNEHLVLRNSRVLAWSDRLRIHAWHSSSFRSFASQKDRSFLDSKWASCSWTRLCPDLTRKLQLVRAKTKPFLWLQSKTKLTVQTSLRKPLSWETAITVCGYCCKWASSHKTASKSKWFVAASKGRNVGENTEPGIKNQTTAQLTFVQHENIRLDQQSSS